MREKLEVRSGSGLGWRVVLVDHQRGGVWYLQLNGVLVDNGAFGGRADHWHCREDAQDAADAWMAANVPPCPVPQPCPCCGGLAMVEEADHYVSCQNPACCLLGPDGEDKVEAVEKWNRLRSVAG